MYETVFEDFVGQFWGIIFEFYLKLIFGNQMSEKSRMVYEERETFVALCAK